MEPEPQPEPEPEADLTRQTTADVVAALQARGYTVTVQPVGGGNTEEGTDVVSPLLEASVRDMLTDPAHPPTQFTHAEWCAARDQLRALGEPYKRASDDWRQRLFRASLAMNQMQHHYGDLLSHVANHGGLFCERAVHVFLRTAPTGAHDSLNNRINLVELRGTDGAVDIDATRRLRSHLHTLRVFRNRCDHDHLEDLRPSDKPQLVHAAYCVAVALIAAANPTLDAGWRDGTVAVIAKHKRYAFITPRGAVRREDNLKVEQSVPGFAGLHGGASIQYRVQLPEPAAGPPTVRELRVSQEKGPSSGGKADESGDAAAPAPAPTQDNKARKARHTNWRSGTVTKIVPGKFAFITPDEDPNGGGVYVHGSLDDFEQLRLAARTRYRAGPSAQKPGTLAAIEVRAVRDEESPVAASGPTAARGAAPRGRAGRGRGRARGESRGGGARGEPSMDEGVPPT